MHERLPTVKEIHLQRVATMAAAAATAQQTSAELEAHEQFASELRSYRGQVGLHQQRRVSKPLWNADSGSASALDSEAAAYMTTGDYSFFKACNGSHLSKSIIVGSDQARAFATDCCEVLACTWAVACRC